MDEMQIIVFGLIILGASLVIFYLTDLVPAKVENTEMTIFLTLGIGLLILIGDKRQSRNIDTNEIHKMIKDELEMVKDRYKDTE